ncbi:MAG: hypothetical protein V1725_01690 [archaeon]
MQMILLVNIGQDLKQSASQRRERKFIKDVVADLYAEHAKGPCIVAATADTARETAEVMARHLGRGDLMVYSRPYGIQKWNKHALNESGLESATVDLRTTGIDLRFITRDIESRHLVLSPKDDAQYALFTTGSHHGLYLLHTSESLKREELVFLRSMN